MIRIKGIFPLIFLILDSNQDEEKEHLAAILLSMEAPIEAIERISFLIDGGFSVNQVALAITEKNTFDMEVLMDELTKVTKGSF